MTNHPKQKFYNLHIDVLDRPTFFREFEDALSKPEKITINFLNAHCFNVAQSNLDYHQALEKSTFLLNDGIGIDLAGRLRGIRFRENLNGTDLIPEMLAFFEKHNLTVFFYGARSEVIERAVAEIKQRYRRLTVVGYSHGFIKDSTFVVDKINESKADVVILGLGVPKQELWVSANMDRLETTKVLICGGAVFDFISGSVMRAPTWVRRARFEWLFRLFQEPIRLFSRYVLGGFLFLYHLLVLRS